MAVWVHIFQREPFFLEIAFLLSFLFFFLLYLDARKKMAHNRYPDTNGHFHKHLAQQHQSEEYNRLRFKKWCLSQGA